MPKAVVAAFPAAFMARPVITPSIMKFCIEAPNASPALTKVPFSFVGSSSSKPVCLVISA